MTQEEKNFKEQCEAIVQMMAVARTEITLIITPDPTNQDVIIKHKIKTQHPTNLAELGITALIGAIGSEMMKTEEQNERYEKEN